MGTLFTGVFLAWLALAREVAKRRWTTARRVGPGELKRLVPPWLRRPRRQPKPSHDHVSDVTERAAKEQEEMALHFAEQGEPGMDLAEWKQYDNEQLARYERIRQADLAFDVEVEAPSCSTAAEALACFFWEQDDRPALEAVEDLLRQTEDFDLQDLIIGKITGRFPVADRYFDYGAYGHFRLPPQLRGDSGFAPQYRDPWPGSRNQVGHFLSILDMALRYERTFFPYNRLMLWATVGHELVPDTEGHLAQVMAGIRKEVSLILKERRTLYDVFMYGTPEELNRLLGDDVNLREGNSLQDLLLSRKAFELAHLLVEPNSPIQTASDVARWIEANLINHFER